jgi:hypothetical protein
MYHLDEVDRAGNRYTVAERDDFYEICRLAAIKQSVRPSYVYIVCNPDFVDIDCPDGLTEEEQELLP